MRVRMAVMALALGGVSALAAPAFSQSAPGSTAPQPSREAPVGDRQPTAGSIAGDNKPGMDSVQREQERVNRIEDRAIGSICSNCGGTSARR